MVMEKSFKSFGKDIQKIKGTTTQLGSSIMGYDEAIEAVRDELKIQLVENLEERVLSSSNNEQVIKNKAYLRSLKKDYRDRITSIVYSKNIKVRDYNDIQLFIDEMVDEFAGHSVLSEAFRDDGVSDIYCIAWNKIYVEKNGKNEKYQKIDKDGNLVPITFRSPKHYKDFLERILREAGKEINNGENKIVDFDLFEDRYCATSKKVSPKDFTITIRKHSESHIKLHQIIDKNVMSQEVADLLGTFILGELNLIYAGITGSGKTTSIRALLDYYVTKANKRMLVCEDTQELFPENDHTLELVSVKSDDPNLAIPLGQLIVTALRLKPKYIVVGEVRSVEAESAVEGMATGHSTIFTMHSGIPMDAVNRLVTKYLMAMPSLGVDVVERIIGSALDYIAIQDDIPSIGRRVTSITEVTFNYETRRVYLKPIVKFDFKKKDFVFVNKISPEKAEKMLRRGITYEQLKPIVEGWDEDEEL